MKNVWQGARFGRLIVLSEAPSFRRNDGNGTFSMWRCLCDCGNTTVARTNNVVNGTTKSCGCLIKERPQNKSKGSESGFTRVYVGYKGSARQRGRVFTLTENQFRALTKGNCHYCNSAPNKIMSTTSKLSEYVYNGVDRMDNKLGYIAENCVSCCECCNKAKGTKTYSEFMGWISRLISHRSSP